MKAAETLQDLIEEFKLRTVYWALCVFAISYFLTHTSKLMWMNVPLSILFVCGLRVLFNEVEFRWKVRKVRQQTYLAHLEKKQLVANDSRLSTTPPSPKWKRKITSPIVKAAMEEFVNKLLHDFVTDMWYSDITPDKEAPELMRAIIMDVLGEIYGRFKGINLVDLLTRDIVDLIGDHLDLFRRNQASIGVDVMGTLTSEERDKRLKHHLVALKELHPALISPAFEYKVLQRLTGGLLAVVLRPREAQCPLVRCIARELVTCLVLQPIMDFASPVYINELIEYIYLATNDEGSKEVGAKQSPNATTHTSDQNESTSRKNASSYKRETAPKVTRSNNQKEIFLDASENLNSGLISEESMQPRPADWTRMLEVATQRRAEVLMPENLENMWTKGRNYKKKAQKIAAGGLRTQAQLSDGKNNLVPLSHGPNREQSTQGEVVDKLEDIASLTANGPKGGLRRSNSTSALNIQPSTDEVFRSESGGPIISEFYSPNFRRHNNLQPTVMGALDMVSHGEGVHMTKLRCRVIGAYFEKVGSKSFAVYSIAVRDADKNTWIVKRRYRNFERLHRHLKDIPNYTLHLPPKRIFSSSTEDAFVHKRCIQLDKYLQDLLSIANVAEQHEVWDFLSVSSKSYSFGKSSTVMRTLAVNVDDAMDDIVRQFNGASDGLVQKVVGSSTRPHEISPAIPTRILSWNADEISKHLSWQNTAESAQSISDNEEGDKDGIRGHEEVVPSVLDYGWHSDTELNSKGFPPRVIKRGDTFTSLIHEKKKVSDAEPVSASLGRHHVAGLQITSDHLEDPVGVPPEWTPPNLTVPMLNLVDKMFQLKRRGWLRRQVFWISKQILQLMMEDAIDDWLLRQIQWLRRDDVIAQGIRWVQDVLWPDGTFFVRLNAQNETDDFQSNEGSFQTTNRGSKVSQPGTFELQLEAARRASDVKKMIFNGAPTALVSLIGPKQYRRSAKDIYYFLQSTICLKQLAYGILELVLVSVFPELRDIVLDVHEKMRGQPV
ncbi:uncharacterized protein LOC131307690 isoform X1 [Rhododendron vialii]|uniref:uncharacterized protein LOC131307690 isoform X1 n=1 Tax=Rhododendron vialii TaxID=182163 RepID=UPI00265F0142|nr:uncharacterized protein LOC131307690 isoform X1 [Rhododendron vialii]XP_058190317.1 uncharacterized protein LOC131307690 isoform X1 [Rhododendron vialii]XP_058190318.1 uncharacterized protein LOC131307690 isoform X1 [Rhododendron vialii]